MPTTKILLHQSQETRAAMPNESFAELFAQTMSGQAFVYEQDGTLSLHFDPKTVQSRMNLQAPDALVLSYTRAMMSFLLLLPEPQRVAIIGLGGGSMVKFCYRQVPTAHITAIEIDPQVIALRHEFKIPEDNARLSILCMDGGHYVQHQAQALDALLVDGFGPHGQPASLCSVQFYDQCAAALAPEGVLVVNLAEADPLYATYLQRLTQAFSGQIRILQAEESGNRLVFASRSAQRLNPKASQLRQNAERLGAYQDWQHSLRQWLSPAPSHAD